MNFESGFRPIIVCLRFIGVDVGSTVDGKGQTKTTIRRWLSYFYAFFCLVFNIGFNIYCRLGYLIFFDVFASGTTTAYDAFLAINSFTSYIGNQAIVSPRPKSNNRRAYFPQSPKVFYRLRCNPPDRGINSCIDHYYNGKFR